MGYLNTFPLSYKVQGLRIVIVGGGEEALNKARLVTKTTAQVVIISLQIEADFSGLALTLIERDFIAADLDHAALVFVAEESAAADRAKVEARARGIPLKEAQSLLVQAFVGEAIETVEHDGLREALVERAEAWLKARA